MAGPSIFIKAVGSLTVPGVYQTGSGLESVALWLVVAIAIIAVAGLVLYVLFFRGSYERERQAALALIGSRKTEPAPRDDSYYRSAPSYSYRGEVPDAVAAAMSGMREEPVEEVEVVEEEDESLPAYLYSGRRPAAGPRRGAPLPAPRAYDGRVDQPPRPRQYAPSRRATSPLDDLLHTGDQDNLREEDRELLREEQLEPEPQVPGLSEDEEVTFEDEPEPAPAVHPPAPYRVGPREKPVWERVLEGGQPTEDAAAEPQGPTEEAAVELVDMEEHPRQVLSRPVADALLREDILKSVKGAPAARAPAPTRRPPAPAAGSRGRPAGPAWTEGRPVFSKPLEEPDVPSTREAPPATGLEDTLGELSHKLRSMDEKAGPRLPPKAEAKMGLQEKKFLEALRAVQEKKREEERTREEEGHRLLEAQMRELERKKKEEEEKRRAEQKSRERQRIERERREREEMGHWEQARRATQEKARSGEESRPDNQRARQEAVRRENERRRKEAQSRQDKSAEIDDVLSRIGIK